MLSIMREESRFNPRAKSQAAARGLLQFIITTARDIRYRVAAAYNAGPKQVALWSRTQAADGDDYFLTAVNFDETKHYVRKVMNSYERYSAIYGDAAPRGGLRAEP